MKQLFTLTLMVLLAGCSVMHPSAPQATNGRNGAFAGKSVAGKSVTRGLYEFTIDYAAPFTVSKDQARTGTCWCFATIAMLESDILRNTGQELDLSEMWVVRNTYPQKADIYVRQHGNATLGQGALGHHAINTIRDFGLMPESVYSGKKDESAGHNHSALFSEITNTLDQMNNGAELKKNPGWRNDFQGLVDDHLTEPPETFNYNGQTYTPQEFAKNVAQINPDDYVYFVSGTHNPFYEQCRLEVPDNWDFYRGFYNVPLDDLQGIADYALKNGIAFGWDGDVSERFYPNQFCILPTDQTMTAGDVVELPIEEINVTQELRQQWFNDFTSTDDHLMLVWGLASDQNGNKYYVTRDSRGPRSNMYEGSFFMSESYLRGKMLLLIINKDGVPPELAKKCGIK